MLLGAQQHTTVESAAAITIQDKIEGKYDENIKPTDKMVMMLSLFDGTKPATSKQHYERFNLYINFQTKSSHLTDPVTEAIDLFEHTLDKTALVWFQTNRSKFKDLTMLKMMFLQRYNPWGKTKREQLKSWNILSFNPKTADVDEHIDLINTLVLCCSTEVDLV